MLRKLVFLWVALSLAVLAFVASALADKSPKATGGVSAVSDTSGFQAEFTAQGTQSDAKGRYRVRFLSGPLSGQFYRGKVSCYDQDGNQASLAGFLDATNNPAITFVRITVEDNGEGSDANGPDRIQVQRFVDAPPTPATRCFVPNQDLTLATVTKGNLQVH